MGEDLTKAALCIACSDIVSPRRAWQTDRSWRWCECKHMATRWRDGARGLIEVTSLHGPDGVLILGLDNAFLAEAARDGRDYGASHWRALHDRTCTEVDPHYLFHKDRRACWALVVAVGESGDVTFVQYADVEAPG
jgi:hypothetical protein